MGEVIRLQKKDEPTNVLKLLRSLPERIENGEVDGVVLAFYEDHGEYRQPITGTWGTDEEISFLTDLLKSWHVIGYYIGSQGVEVEDD